MKYIYANLKTNFTGAEIGTYLAKFHQVAVYHNQPLIFLNHLYILEAIHKNGPMYLGVQSFDTNDVGAYTSSVSYKQIALEGIHHVLLGHSEEMEYFDRTLGDVNCQLKLALDNGLSPVVCFGEEENENLVQRTSEVEEQLRIILNEVENIDQITFAYEPKWAIGGHQVIDVPTILQTIQSIKDFIYDSTGQVAKVLYGGSVKPENIHEILDNDIVDGVLIGTAALNIDGYLKMVQDHYA